MVLIRMNDPSKRKKLILYAMFEFLFHFCYSVNNIPTVFWKNVILNTNIKCNKYFWIEVVLKLTFPLNKK